MKYLHTMVRVSDLEKSLDFYCNKLGLENLGRFDIEEGRFSLVFLAAPGQKDAQVELTWNWDKDELGEGRNFGHLAYQVDDIYETCDRLMQAGVTIALGTDGVSSNDTASIFDVMRVAGLLHGASGPDHETWLSAAELLHAATLGGARSAMLEAVTGSLEPGKAADLIMLDLDSCAFTPLNDVARHLVYAANGGHVETVMVAGEIVVRDGRMTRIDETAVLAEIRERMPAYLAGHAEVEARNRELEPWFVEIHRRAAASHSGVYRYAGDAALWPRNW